MDPRQGSRRPTAAQNESSVSSITQGVSAVHIGDMAGRPSGEAKLLADARAAEGKVLTGKGETQTISYTAEKVIGSGSFGIVFQASVVGTGQTVAIKKVLQDRRYKNRELQIMKTLNHQNVVMMKHSFYSNGEKPDEVYLNVVMEFVPETVYRVARHYNKSRQTVPIFFIKLYGYQMCRSLAYLHSIGICHRDIKPQNILVDPQSGVCKICDFGSAKMLVRGEPNVAYICSRYYRAPELVFGATDYTTSIDIWSVGCVIGELMTGSPLFPGENGTDQLVEIIKILGTPSREEIISMNPNYTDHKFPQVKPVPWTKVFRSKTAPEAIDLVSKMLVYTPEARLKPVDCMLHPFFDELRDPNTKMPNGRPLPPLFNFSPSELKGATPEQIRRLVPEHAKTQLQVELSQLINAVLSGGQGVASSSSPSLA